jgi:hypothetical protein
MLSAFISWRSYSEVGSSMVLGATNHTRRAEYTIGASWRAHLSNQSLTTGLHGTLQTYWGPRFSGHQTCPRNNDTQVYRPLGGTHYFPYSLSFHHIAHQSSVWCPLATKDDTNCAAARSARGRVGTWPSRARCACPRCPAPGMKEKAEPGSE